MTNLYEILGADRSATQDELQAAYRRAAMRCHPDREGGSEEAFKALQRAGEILLDPEKRKEYDRTGRIPGEAPSPTERVQALLADILDKMGEADFHRGLRRLKQKVEEDGQQLANEAAEAEARVRAHRKSVAAMPHKSPELLGIAAMREALLVKQAAQAAEAHGLFLEAKRILSPIDPLRNPQTERGLEALMRKGTYRY